MIVAVLSEATVAFRVFYGNVLYLPYLLFSFNDLPLPINFFTHLFPDLFIENHSNYRQRYILIPRRESRLRGEKHANVSTCFVISVVENFRNFPRRGNFTNIQGLLLGGHFFATFVSRDIFTDSHSSRQGEKTNARQPSIGTLLVVDEEQHGFSFDRLANYRVRNQRVSPSAIAKTCSVYFKLFRSLRR